MNVIICGAFTNKTKKPCKYCSRFLLWGISTGYCFKHRKDMMTWDHCKYYKRDAEMYTIRGKCKHPELECL